MEKDLHITDTQYLLALTIFFFRYSPRPQGGSLPPIKNKTNAARDSYSAFEVPSNIVLKRIRPSIWLSFLMTMWGICMVRPTDRREAPSSPFLHFID